MIFDERSLRTAPPNSDSNTPPSVGQIQPAFLLTRVRSPTVTKVHSVAFNELLVPGADHCVICDYMVLVRDMQQTTS